MTINLVPIKLSNRVYILRVCGYYAPTSPSDFIRLDKLPHSHKTWLLVVWLSVGFVICFLPNYWSFPHIMFQTVGGSFMNCRSLFIFIMCKWVQITVAHSAVHIDSLCGFTGFAWFWFLIPKANNLWRILVADSRWQAM